MKPDLDLNKASKAVLIGCALFLQACSSGSDSGGPSPEDADAEVTTAVEVPMDPEQTDMLQQVNPQSIGDTSVEDNSGLDGLLIPAIFESATDVNLEFAQSSAALVEQLNDSLLLPVDIDVTFADCGTANAFFAPANFNFPTPEIVICHELTNLLSDFYNTEEQAFLATAFVLMHELGHALTNVLQLPVLGIEESYVDGIAAVFLGESGLAEGSVLAGWFFGSQGDTPFFDSHRAGPQRLGDLACWGVGADPSLQLDPLINSISAQLIQGGRNCVAEYNQQLLGLNAVLGDNILGGLNILSIPPDGVTVTDVTPLPEPAPTP